MQCVASVMDPRYIPEAEESGADLVELRPEYYYTLIQIPMSEYLPAMGTLVAIILGLKKLYRQNQIRVEAEAEIISEAESVPASNDSEANFGVFFGLMS